MTRADPVMVVCGRVVIINTSACGYGLVGVVVVSTNKPQEKKCRKKSVDWLNGYHGTTTIFPLAPPDRHNQTGFRDFITD